VDVFRLVCAILIVSMLPPAVGYWYVVHPWPGFWRKLGPRRSIVILFTGLGVTMVGLFLIHDRLVGRDLGTHWSVFACGVVVYLLVLPIGLQVRKHLSFRILAGLPEMSTEDPGKLLTEGIYARMRHPRYASVIGGTIGFALIANYLGAYLVTALCIAAIFPIIAMEERELRERFGGAYAAYSKNVPRFALWFGSRAG
jgi:protein-S-isoprenylcysteine O-methyltransferase Ste14